MNLIRLSGGFANWITLNDRDAFETARQRGTALAGRAKLHCRFWLGFLGGDGLSPLPACWSNLRVTLIAAWLISTKERRPSSLKAPAPLLKLSRRSPIPFPLPHHSSALP